MGTKERFRVRENAAPLKLVQPRPSKTTIRRFRVRENAAPLKQSVEAFIEHPVDGFRVRENAAPLKLVKPIHLCDSAAWFPRS